MEGEADSQSIANSNCSELDHDKSSSSSKCCVERDPLICPKSESTSKVDSVTAPCNFDEKTDSEPASTLVSIKRLSGWMSPNNLGIVNDLSKDEKNKENLSSSIILETSRARCPTGKIGQKYSVSYRT